MTKEGLIASIAKFVSIPNPGLGVGSSVYKALFVGVCDRFGFDANGTMPELAQRIVTAAIFPTVPTTLIAGSRSPEGDRP